MTGLSWLLGGGEDCSSTKEMKELWGLRKTVSLSQFYEEQVKISLRMFRKS